MLKRFLDNARPRFAPAPASLVLLLIAAAPALAGGPGSSHNFFDSVIEWIGFAEIDDEAQNLFIATLFVFAGFFGYFSHKAMQAHGFGIVLNGLVSVAGICIVLHFALPRLPLVKGLPEEMRFSLGLIVAAAGGPLFLVLAAFVKNVVTRQFNSVLIRVGTPPRPQPFRREAELDPRIAAAVRKKR